MKKITCQSLVTYLVIITWIVSPLYIQYFTNTNTMNNYHSKEALNLEHVDETITSFMSRDGGTGRELPVIIVFPEGHIPGTNHDLVKNLARTGFKIKHTFSLIPAISGFVTNEAIQQINALGMRARLYENKMRTLDLASLDQLETKSRLQQTQSWWVDAIGIHPGGTHLLNGTGIKIGVLDTGIGYNTSSGTRVHQDLAGKIAGNVNFATGLAPNDYLDGYGHGTHVAGIIAASGDASSGQFAGIAPGSRIYNVKVLNDTGSGFEDDIIKGIEWSVNNSLDIINLSLGGGTPDPYDPESLALKNATSQGLICVVAAGNDGSKYLTVNSPAAAVGAISVGATNMFNQVTGFSSRGPSLVGSLHPCVVAPGASIISVLGKDTFIERYVDYYGGSIGDSGSDARYVALSGTSMAAPLVAGSIGLLLQQYHAYNLAPEIISTSLMETAQDLNIEPCVQGMGLVNVSNALLYLENLKTTTNFSSLLRVYPKQIPFSPFDFFFPGEEKTITLTTVFKSIPSFHLDLTAVPAGIVITPERATITTTAPSGEELMRLHIKTAFELAPGAYNFSINLQDSMNTTRDEITVLLEIRDARYKILLNSYNSLQDTYTGPGRTGRVAMDYHQLRNVLAQEGIQLVTDMDYWGTGYNSTSGVTKLTYQELMEFNAVIILPVKAGLFPDEIEAIKKYNEQGGNLIILGTRYQQFAAVNVGQLLDALNVNVRFKLENFEEMTDLGWEGSLNSIQIDSINNTHFINDKVTHIDWNTGTMLQLNGPEAQVLVSDDLGTPLVTFTPRMAGKGAVLIGGSEEIVPIDLNLNDSANTRFFMNVIDYFLSEGDIHVNKYGPSRIDVQTQIPFLFQVVNRTSDVAFDYTSVSFFSCGIYNETQQLVSPVSVENVSGTWFGSFAINASSLPPSATPYHLDLNLTIGGCTVSARWALVRYASPRDMVAMGVSNDTIYKDSYVTLENYSQVINQDIMLNGYSNSIFSTRYSYYFESNNVDITDFYWNASKNIGSGNYMFQFKNTAWNGTDPFTLQQRVGFQVLNHEPTISTTGSFFQGTSFNQTQVENGYVRIQSINAGTPLDLTVMGTDVETGPLEMSAFVLFSLTYIIGDNVGLLPFHAVPIIERLTRDENDRFQGSITIPNEVTYSIGGSNITKSMATTEKYLGALIVVLRDDDGSYDYFIILLNISVVYPVDIFFIISLISVCGVAIAILMFVRKRTRQYKVPGEYAKERLPYDFKFCPYCGNEVGGTRVMYCPRCHKEIDFY